MKIVCLLGSPREKGNSATIAKRFCSTAERLGAEVRTFVLNKLDYQGCQGCMACKTKLDRCILKDELTQVLDAVRETEVLLLASPIYFGDLSSQMKAFVDRAYSFLAPPSGANLHPCRLPPGKKLVFVLTQANPDESLFADTFSRYDYFFKWWGISESHLLRACGVREAGEIEGRRDVLEQAEKLARQLCA